MTILNYSGFSVLTSKPSYEAYNCTQLNSFEARVCLLWSALWAYYSCLWEDITLSICLMYPTILNLTQDSSLGKYRRFINSIFPHWTLQFVNEFSYAIRTCVYFVLENIILRLKFLFSINLDSVKNINNLNALTWIIDFRFYFFSFPGEFLEFANQATVFFFFSYTLILLNISSVIIAIEFELDWIKLNRT